MAEQELPSNAVMHAPRLGKSRISRSTLTKRTQVCIEICCQPAYFALISAINMLARNVERHNFARLHVSCKPWQHFCNETRVTSAVLRCVRWLQGRRASKPVKEDRLQPAAGGRAGDGSWSVSRCTGMEELRTQFSDKFRKLTGPVWFGVWTGPYLGGMVFGNKTNTS